MSIHSVDELLALRNGPVILRRLRWLDDRLHWHGVFRRSDLVERFSLSPQQASADIGKYQEMAPGNARFDPATKAYVRTGGYAPVFPKDVFRWMQHAHDDGDATVIPCATVTVPTRRVDPAVMGALMAAFEARRAVSVSYQSLSSADSSRRTLCPHHIVDTGDRVHVRAWDALKSRFADFVVSRIQAAEPDPGYPWVDAVADTLWNETCVVRLAPHPGLSPSQRAVVESEYGMRDGEAAVEVRRALATYLLDRMGLLDAVLAGDGTPRAARGVRCLNPGELRPYLPGGARDGADGARP